MMIEFRPIRKEERQLLWNINQKYLYEMTLYYPDTMDAQGEYHYGDFDAYFADPKRKALFLFHDEVLVGFAMLHSDSYIGREADFVMAQFTVFPSYRKKHFALDAARQILSAHRGRWEIKYNERNVGAKRLWNAVAAPYNPVLHRLNDEETVLSFCNETASAL